jgi:hypothetical protein
MEWTTARARKSLITSSLLSLNEGSLTEGNGMPRTDLLFVTKSGKHELKGVRD